MDSPLKSSIKLAAFLLLMKSKLQLSSTSSWPIPSHLNQQPSSTRSTEVRQISTSSLMLKDSWFRSTFLAAKIQPSLLMNCFTDTTMSESATSMTKWITSVASKSICKISSGHCSQRFNQKLKMRKLASTQAPWKLIVLARSDLWMTRTMSTWRRPSTTAQVVWSLRFLPESGKNCSWTQPTECSSHLKLAKTRTTSKYSHLPKWESSTSNQVMPLRTTALNIKLTNQLINHQSFPPKWSQAWTSQFLSPITKCKFNRTQASSWKALRASFTNSTSAHTDGKSRLNCFRRRRTFSCQCLHWTIWLVRRLNWPKSMNLLKLTRISSPMNSILWRTATIRSRR